MQTTTDVKLCFGMRDGHVVHISQLTAQEKGLRCNCTCSHCHQPLQAKMGTKRAHHFAHNSNCDIWAANQTAIHYLAEEIISNTHKVSLPPVLIYLRELDFSAHELYGYENLLPEYLVLAPATMAICEDITLEKRIGRIVPDILLTINGQTIFAEIAVSHFVDEKKLEKIVALGVPTFEIDLSGLLSFEHLTKHELEQILLRPVARKWLLPPNKSEAMKLAKTEYLALMEATRAERDALLKNRGTSHQITNTQVDTAPLNYSELSLKEQQRLKLHAVPQKDQYALGLKQVLDKNFNTTEPIKDEFGLRWLLCTVCGEIYRDDQMAEYGGPGNENKGVCRDCSRNPKAKD